MPCVTHCLITVVVIVVDVVVVGFAIDISQIITYSYSTRCSKKTVHISRWC